MKHMAIKRTNSLQEGKSICTLSKCEYVSIFIFMCGRFVERCFSVFSFAFYNVVKLWSSLMTYPKATGQTVWQGSIICHHCAYGCSLRSLLKGALRSFAAVARLVWAPASAGPCVITPRGCNIPRRPSMSTAYVQMQVWTPHIAREIYLLWSPFVFSCYSRTKQRSDEGHCPCSHRGQWRELCACYDEQVGGKVLSHPCQTSTK